MKIISLAVENVKRVSAAHIQPDGSLVQITGKNGQGKTSVLDAIWWALDGANSIQKSPVRDGTEKARIRLDLGELVITRRFTKQEDGTATTSLKVENGEGAAFSSPQAMLDALLGGLTFDPLRFLRMNSRERLEALQGLVPDFDFDDTMEKIEDAMAERRLLNREVSGLKVEVEALSENLPEEKPDRIDPVEINQKLAEARDTADKNASIRRSRTRYEESNARLGEEIAELEAKIQMKRETIATQAAWLTDNPDPGDDPDTSALAEALANSQRANAVADKWDDRDEKRAKLAEKEAEAEGYTKNMKNLRESMKDAISGADLGVEGLTVDDEGSVMLGGVPFDQGSDAERLRAAVSLAMAEDATLRVIRVRDGSLLDEDGLAMVGAMAEERGFQVWVERVDSSGEIGVVMEDGHVKGTNPEAVAEEIAEIAKPKVKTARNKVGKRK